MSMSGSTSLRNAIRRVEHKERQQPSHRKKFGFLEKHKDYVVRSNDFKKKKNIIKSLKQKASERNPDEFYFKMMNSKVSNGIHKATKDNSLDQRSIDLLKTQDLGYLTHRKSVDDQKILKIKDNFQLLGVSGKTNKRTLFVDSETEISTELIESKLKSSSERLKSAQLALDLDSSQWEDSSSKLKVMAKKQSKSLSELQQRMERSSKIKKAMDELVLERNLSSKGTKKKTTTFDPKTLKETTVYKWKRQRSR